MTHQESDLSLVVLPWWWHVNWMMWCMHWLLQIGSANNLLKIFRSFSQMPEKLKLSKFSLLEHFHSLQYSRLSWVALSSRLQRWTDIKKSIFWLSRLGIFHKTVTIWRLKTIELTIWITDLWRRQGLTFWTKAVSTASPAPVQLLPRAARKGLVEREITVYAIAREKAVVGDC